MIHHNTAVTYTPPWSRLLVQVWLQHSPEDHTVTSPWTVEVEQNTASCKGVESVQLVATLTGGSTGNILCSVWQ
jgi:hypothetical protein